MVLLKPSFKIREQSGDLNSYIILCDDAASFYIPLV